MTVVKTLFRNLCLTLLFVTLTHHTEAQVNQKSLNSLLEEFKIYQENILVEKVFLHLDKTQYVQGESLWFKSYLVAGAYHTLSDLSKTIYVELLPAEGEPIETLILRSEKGLAKGNILLDKELAPGDYYLRAYTQWMKNNGEKYFFRKKIKVHSPDRSNILASKSEYIPLDLKFYPEGGHLVKNVASYVAFEMRGTRLRESKYTGAIYNRQGELITTFETEHENMGKFSFVPKERGYYATIKGFEEKFTLPEIKETGMVMLVDNMKKNHLNVTIKTDLPSSEEYHLVAHTRGLITFTTDIQLKKGRAFTRIDKRTLPEGITHITLMDGQLNPLAERLVFVHRQEGLDIEIRTDKTDYASRELVNLEVLVRDYKGRPVEGTFSLSAFDGLVENDQPLNNIRANLLLSSDLKGYIHNPGQYLQKDKATARNLDLLLMVKGWSKFNWSDLQNYKEKEFFPPENGIQITGRLMTEALKRAKNSRVVLFNANTPNETIMALADEDGEFAFQNQVFYDTTRLMFQGFQRKRAKNMIVTVDSTLTSMPFTPFDPTPEDSDPLRTDALKQRWQTKIFADSIFERRNGFTDLGVVTVEARKESIRDLPISDATIAGNLDDLDFTKIPYEEKKNKDPYQVMMGRVPGLMFAPLGGPNGGGEPGLLQPTFGMGNRWKGAPRVFIDGIETGYEAVYALEPSRIDYVVTSRSNPGIISIYLLDVSRYNALNLSPGLLIRKLHGYHVPDEFYVPVYDGTNTNRDLPDQRTTIFWEPMLTTDKSGKAKVSFYTPDQSTRMVIDVQGMRQEGSSGASNKAINIGAKQ